MMNVEQTRVLVHGALGRMGQEVVRAVCNDPEMVLVGAVDAFAANDILNLPDGSAQVPLAKGLETIVKSTSPQVMVDFTRHDAAMLAARIASANGVSLVIGTSGISDSDLAELQTLSAQSGTGIAVIPNFSLGAVMMTHLAKIASKYFDYAEIIELHHEKKIDAPSGTAMATAKLMVEARGKSFTYPQNQKDNLPHARGAEYEGIALHSVRSPGYVASQEIILGEAGGALKIRHDQINREGFMPGVVLAVKKVAQSKTFILGLDKIIGLE